ncbi:unnamed protein product [Arabidopsis halleri]
MALSADPPDPFLIAELSSTLEKAYIEEEKFWKQRSRIQWLQDGEKNTAFFHAATRNRRTCNRFTTIEDDSGASFHQEQDIVRIIAEYYQHMFTSQSEGPFDLVSEVLSPKVTQETNARLIRIPDAAEIYLAVKAIHPSKAPGPDGFTAAGRKVLQEGLGWLVGNGESVRVWTDPWLSFSSPMRPIGPLNVNMKWLRVADLIDPGSKQWNWTAVRETIPAYEDQIRRIPLSSLNQPDRLAWLPAKNGQYSSRLGYGIMAAKEIPQSQLSFNWQAMIWKVRTVPKIQMFMWKAALGALPSNANLFYRGIQVDPKCKRCNQPETNSHILRGCPFAQRVWALAPLTTNLANSTGTMLEWLAEIKASISLPPTGLVVASLAHWICWLLWKARNALLFSTSSFSEVEIVSKAQAEAKAWQEAQAQKTKQPIETTVEMAGTQLNGPIPAHLPVSLPISPPMACFTDAAWDAVSLNAGLGWFFRGNTDLSAHNEQSMTSSAIRSHVNSALEAEAWALLAALSNAQTRGLDALQVFSDCQVLIKLLNSEDIHTEIHAIVGDVRALSSLFKQISFNFISRCSNSKADLIAKDALVAFVNNNVP